MAEADTITGLSGSEEKDLARMRDNLRQGTDPSETLGRPSRDEPPVHAPGLSDKSYEAPAAEPDPEPQPAAEPAQPQQEPQQEQQQGIPPAALFEEREKRRALQQELEEGKAKWAKAEGRLETLMQTVYQSQQDRLNETKQQAAPDPQTDLEGYVQWMSDRYKEEQAANQKELSDIKQQMAYTSEVQQVKDRALSEAQAFAAAQPDFGQAYQWMRNQDYGALVAQGYSEADAAKILDQQELNFLADHQRAGRNSAQSVYKAAVARGWQTQQQPQPQPNGGPAPQPIPQPSPGAPPSVPQQPPSGPSLQNMQAGMMESQSLDQAAGASAAVPLDLEALVNKSDAEFAENINLVRQVMRQQGLR